MSEIENAIEDLLNARNSDCLLDFPKAETLDLAIQALRKEQEREAEPKLLND